MKISPAMALAAGLVAAPMAAHADANTMHIATMADSCAGCHGTDGASPGAMPGFSNKTADVIKKALLEYKAGTKEATVMDRIVKAYSDADLDAMATFFAAKNKK